MRISTAQVKAVMGVIIKSWMKGEGGEDMLRAGCYMLGACLELGWLAGRRSGCVPAGERCGCQSECSGRAGWDVCRESLGPGAMLAGRMGKRGGRVLAVAIEAAPMGPLSTMARR